LLVLLQKYNNLHLTKRHNLHVNALTFGIVSFSVKNQMHAQLFTQFYDNNSDMLN